MTDVESVIKGLECRNNLEDDTSTCKDCAYFKFANKLPYCDYHGLLNDAIELLRQKKGRKTK